MTEKFRNKYRIASSRLPGYDYSRDGAYFITICTKNHENLFGDVIGLPVDAVYADETVTVETGLRPVSTNIKLSAEIKLSDFGKIGSDCWYDLTNHYPNIILDQFIVMPNHIHGIIMIQNYSGIKQNHGIPEFVRAFKSFSSRKINEFRKSKQPDTWQLRYYDHIIRSDNV